MDPNTDPTADPTALPAAPAPDDDQGKDPADIIAQIKDKLASLPPDVAGEISPLLDELSTAVGADEPDNSTEPDTSDTAAFANDMKKPESRLFPGS